MASTSEFSRTLSLLRQEKGVSQRAAAAEAKGVAVLKMSTELFYSSASLIIFSRYALAACSFLLSPKR